MKIQGRLFFFCLQKENALLFDLKPSLSRLWVIEDSSTLSVPMKTFFLISSNFSIKTKLFTFKDCSDTTLLFLSLCAVWQQPFPPALLHLCHTHSLRNLVYSVKQLYTVAKAIWCEGINGQLAILVLCLYKYLTNLLVARFSLKNKKFSHIKKNNPHFWCLAATPLACCVVTIATSGSSLHEKSSHHTVPDHGRL